MSQWLLIQRYTFTKSFPMKLSGSDCECLIDNDTPSTVTPYEILKDEEKPREKNRHQSSFKKTFSFKNKSKRVVEKSEPVLPAVLQTYNQSLFKENNSWL